MLTSDAHKGQDHTSSLAVVARAQTEVRENRTRSRRCNRLRVPNTPLMHIGKAGTRPEAGSQKTCALACRSLFREGRDRRRRCIRGPLLFPFR